MHHGTQGLDPRVTKPPLSPASKHIPHTLPPPPLTIPLNNERHTSNSPPQTHRSKHIPPAVIGSLRPVTPSPLEVAPDELRLSRTPLLLEPAVGLLDPQPHLLHLALLRLFRVRLHLPLLLSLLLGLFSALFRLTPPAPPGDGALACLSRLFFPLALCLTLPVTAATVGVCGRHTTDTSRGGLPRPRFRLPLVLETPRLRDFGEVGGRVRNVSEPSRIRRK